MTIVEAVEGLVEAVAEEGGHADQSRDGGRRDVHPLQGDQDGRRVAVAQGRDKADPVQDDEGDADRDGGGVADGDAWGCAVFPLRWRTVAAPDARARPRRRQRRRR